MVVGPQALLDLEALVLMDIRDLLGVETKGVMTPARMTPKPMLGVIITKVLASLLWNHRVSYDCQATQTRGCKYHPGHLHVHLYLESI